MRHLQGVSEHACRSGGERASRLLSASDRPRPGIDDSQLALLVRRGAGTGPHQLDGPAGRPPLARDDDLTTVTAEQVRDLVVRLHRLGHHRDGDPEILIVFGAGTGSGHRDFTAQAPNQLWVADATRIPAGGGMFWTAAVRDAFASQIVGWKCSDRCDTEPMLEVPECTVWARDVRTTSAVSLLDRSAHHISGGLGGEAECCCEADR